MLVFALPAQQKISWMRAMRGTWNRLAWEYHHQSSPGSKPIYLIIHRFI